MAGLDVTHLTYVEIEREIARLPAIIVPLGGCEPYAQFGALGVTLAVAEAVSRELSQRMNMLVAPTLAFGNSTAFMSFGGSAGIKPRTLTNALCETIRMWFFQGIRTAVIVDALLDNREAVETAQKRLAASHPGNNVIVVALQRDGWIADFLKTALPGSELYRAEFGMLSMAAWIDPGLVRDAKETAQKPLISDVARFKHWRKRGSDPEQFRKFAANCSCSAAAQAYTAEFGKKLFEFIVSLAEETVTRAIQTRLG
jgi:creatinine amidohydrolase/Fe(II)-dependent formamide hydrolase-like protein